MDFASWKITLPAYRQNEFFGWGWDGMWNVTLAKFLCQGKEALQLEVLPFAEALHFTLLADMPYVHMQYDVEVNIAYALSEANLKEPLIVVPVEGDIKGSINGMFIIDGYHRIFRAVRESVVCLPYYLLTAEESLRCRMDI